MDGITVFLNVMEVVMALAGGIAIGWGIGARPGTIPLINVISGKRAEAAAKTIQPSESAKYHYVRRTTVFGIRKKRELIPNPYVARCPVTGKPLAAFFPKEDFQKMANTVVRVDDEEKQKAILKAAEFQSKFEREKNKSLHEINKQVDRHLKTHFENLAIVMKSKQQSQGGMKNG